MEVSWGELRRTPNGNVTARLTISEGGSTVKYRVYLRDSITLRFCSADRSRAELAVNLLRLVKVKAKVWMKGSRWHVVATTDMIAAGDAALRGALAEVVRKAFESGWVDERRARRWLEKLERGRMLREGWPKYGVRLDSNGTLAVVSGTTNPDSVARETQRLREMGLVEGIHFVAKMPEGDRGGYVRLLKRGLKRVAWLSAYGSGRQRELAAQFVEHILQRAWEKGEEVYEKVRKIVEEGKTRGLMLLEGFKRAVEVDGKMYAVKVIGGDARLEGDRLKVEIVAEVDGVRSRYVLAFGRYGKSAARAVAKDADPDRLAALLKALLGKKPKIYRKKNTVVIVRDIRELEGLSRFVELADAVEEWLSRQLSDQPEQKRDLA